MGHFKLQSNFSSLNVLETYFKIADIFKIKAAVSLPKLFYKYSCINLIPQSNISHIYGYNRRNLLLLAAFNAYLRYLFVTKYTCLCFISIFA